MDSNIIIPNKDNHKQRRSRSRRRSQCSRRREDPSAANVEYNLLKCRLQALESLIKDSRERSASASAPLPENVPGPSSISLSSPPLPPLSSSSNIANNNDIILNESYHRPCVNEQYNHSRFVGRFELIPEFSGSVDGLTIDQWIDKINSVGNLYHWDDSAKIFCMIARLKGNAQSWYECQSTIPSTWPEWTEKLLLAFPSHKGIASKLKDFVNTERLPDEDVISFYYKKLRIGKYCNLPDTVIADVIISTLNNNLIKVSAHAANCKTTEKLLQYLTDSDYVNTRHDYQHQQKKHRPNIKFPRTEFKRPFEHDRRNKYPATINKPLNCTYCQQRGHSREMCFKLQGKNNFNNFSRKINLISTDDAKYHITAKINDIDIPAYIDFGSACNIMTLSTATKLKLPIDYCKQTIMRGYGGAFVASLGETKARIKVDEVEREVSILIVDDTKQEMDLLIGRTFTEALNILVIKTQDKLQFQEENSA